MTKSCKYLRRAVILAVGGTFLSATSVLAQSITIDGTLSPAQTLTGPAYTIPQSVGQTVGSNLFQSFGRFNLNMGEIANFESAGNIRNILSRVTGGSRSLIDGLIFTSSPNVNLFLINPSGIVFGPNARLDVGGSTRGSFVATTVDALVWSNGSQFSATNPGGASSLLTIVGDPSGFLSTLRTPPPIDVNRSTLRVAEGQSLLLLGGNVNLDGSNLFVDFTEGGRIELGGVAEPGNVGLNTNGNILNLNFPENLGRGDVSLTNGATLDATAGNGGSIAINARNIDILAGSRLLGGIGSLLGTVDSQAGDVTLNATGAIKIQGQGSRIQNELNSDATGNAGDIRITTGSLSVTDGAQLSANTFGQGDGGNVFIDASESVSFNGSLTGAISAVLQNAKGQGGNIRINSDSLSLANGAQLQASTFGQGNAGSVIINARKSVSFDGGDDSGFVSGIFNDLNETGVGQSGGIRINTNSLSVTNGAELTSSTYGKGDAGDVIIDANTVSFKGLRFTDGRILSSGVFSNVQRDAEGNGGKIQITTDSLLVADSAELDVGTFGQGNGGNVIIDARGSVSFDNGNIFSSVEEKAIGRGGDIRISSRSISFANGAEIQTSTQGQGDAGNVAITASDNISFDGFGTSEFETGSFPSGVFSAVNETAKGRGGDIRLNTGSLSITNGAQLVASTRGQGNAGSVLIDAQDVLFDGISSDGMFASNAFSTVEQGAVGNGGNITISTGSLRITNGAQLLANTDGQGDAGNIQITASDSVNISGTSSISGRSSALFTFTDTYSTGKGGNITVNTSLLRLSDGGVLDARTRNEGNGGNITVNTSLFEALNGGQLLSTTSSSGSAGKITVNATDKVVVNGNDTTFNNRLTQFGGNVANVDANSGFFVRSESTGSAGDIEVNSPKVILDNSGRLNAESASGNGGNINLQSNLLLLRRESQISTSAGTAPAGGNGGNIKIDAGFIVGVPQENSDITANAFSGNGGTVTINAQGIFGIQSRQQPTEQSDITASSTGGGINGVVDINTLEIDPSRGFINLPTNVVNTPSLVAQSCSAFGKKGSEFIVTGRGGLPLGPDDFLSSDVVWSDTRLTALPVSPSPRVTPSVRKTAEGVLIVPATGWVFDEKTGEVTLIAEDASSSGVGSNQVKCIVP